jgi:hypothetical protein
MPNLLIISEDSIAQFESCFRIQFFMNQERSSVFFVAQVKIEKAKLPKY